MQQAPIKKIKLIPFLLFSTLCLLAQNPPIDSSLYLNEITITASRSQNFSTGSQHLKIDSSQTTLLKNTNLAEVLSLQSSIFIKNYGPGRLATTSLRGGSASQTAVIWNGFNLENNMLGQADFALIPSLFIDDISIQYGNTSTLWGSGAIGGAIRLNSERKMRKGWQLRSHNRIGSFLHFNHGIVAKYGSKRFKSVSKVFIERAKNDFSFQRRDGTINRLPHSRLRQSGWLQENYIQLTERQALGIHFWYQNVDRELPPTLSQTFSEAVQKDSIRRWTLDWKYIGEVVKVKARTGYFIEKLDYQDAAASIFSLSDSRKWINEVEAFYEPHRQHRFNIGINYSHLAARSAGYTQQVQQQRTALFIAHHWNSKNYKLKTNLNIRQEWAGGEAVPFIASGGFEYDFHSNWQWSGNVSRSYRLPTFNDLYWSPGGNPDLLAESGWGEALSLRYRKMVSNKNSFSNLETTLTLYNKMVDNWIIWLPQGSYHSPQNLLKVWSRGLENRWAYAWQKTAWSGRFTAQYQLTFSTQEKGQTAEDARLGKQLIYVPLHQGNFSGTLNYKTWGLHYYQNLQGRVYTLADNSEYLSGFSLSHLHFSKSMNWSKFSANVFFKIHNLWNKNYQVIANYPMPRRHFELGISIYYR